MNLKNHFDINQHVYMSTYVCVSVSACVCVCLCTIVCVCVCVHGRETDIWKEVCNYIMFSKYFSAANFVPPTILHVISNLLFNKYI